MVLAPDTLRSVRPSPLNQLMSPPPDPLDTILDTLRESPAIRPSFRAEVWARISTQASTTRGYRFLELWSGRWLAAGFVAACIACGVLLAEHRIAREQVERNREIARNYLILIDPLLQSQDRSPSEHTSMP